VLEAVLAQRAVLLQFLGNGAQPRLGRPRLAGDRHLGHIAFNHGDQHLAVGKILRRHEGKRQRVAALLVHLRYRVGRFQQLRHRDLTVGQRRELRGHLVEWQRLCALDAEVPRRQACIEQVLHGRLRPLDLHGHAAVRPGRCNLRERLGRVALDRAARIGLDQAVMERADADQQRGNAMTCTHGNTPVRKYCGY
jgi:hypothetical protein